MQEYKHNYDLKLIYFISRHEFNVIVLQRHAHCKKKSDHVYDLIMIYDIQMFFSHCLFLIELIDVVCGPVGLTVKTF